VAVRLDEALAGLHAETPEPAPTRDEPDAPATVVPLRRRVSRLPRYVLAAAAVVVIGYGTTQVVGNTLGGSSSDSGSAGGGSSSGDTTAERGAGSGGAPSAADDGAPPPSAFAPLDDLGIQGLEPLDTARLDENLATLEDSAVKAPAQRSARRLAEVCGPRAPVPGSRTRAAAYDGRPTLVVYLPPEGGSQRVDLYLCDTKQPRRPFRSVTLPTGE
jgi:hypothetical protein